MKKIIFIILSIVVIVNAITYDTAYVDTYLGSGNNDGSSWANAYKSMIAWEAGEDADLTTGTPRVHVCIVKSTGGAADTTGIIINGWVTNDTCYIKIIAASGHEALKTGWSTSRWRMEVKNDQAITCLDPRVRLENLQIKTIYTSGSAYETFQLSAAGGYIQIKNCRMEHSGGGSYNILETDGIGLTIIDVINSIFIGAGADGISGNNNKQLNVYNCLFTKCASYGIDYRDTGSVTVKNCIFINNGTRDYDSSFHTGTRSFSYNAADDAFGTNRITPKSSNWNNELLDTSVNDFSLKSDGNLANNGLDDPANGLFTTDIDGDIRSDWDVGPDETSAPPSPPDTCNIDSISPDTLKQINLNGDTIKIYGTFTDTTVDSITMDGVKYTVLYSTCDSAAFTFSWAKKGFRKIKVFQDTLQDSINIFLQSDSAVYFCGECKATVTSWNTDSIVINVPSCPGYDTCDITVYMDDSVNTMVNGWVFLDGSAMVIDSIRPIVWYYGKRLDWYGRGFGNIQGTGKIILGTDTLGTAELWTDTHIIDTIPSAATRGYKHSTVINSGGLSALANDSIRVLRPYRR